MTSPPTKGKFIQGYSFSLGRSFTHELTVDSGTMVTGPKVALSIEMEMSFMATFKTFCAPVLVNIFGRTDDSTKVNGTGIYGKGGENSFFLTATCSTVISSLDCAKDQVALSFTTDLCSKEAFIKVSFMDKDVDMYIKMGEFSLETSATDCATDMEKKRIRMVRYDMKESGKTTLHCNGAKFRRVLQALS